MAGERSALLPGGTFPLTLVYGARLVAKREWFNSLFHRWTLTRPRPQGLAAVAPRDRRPGSVMLGRAILAGRFELGGKVLDTGNRGDPWDRASPSRAFAVALHRLGWMNDLMALGPTAHAEALRLTLDWSRVFGRWNKFSWNPQVLERRVFNLACHLPTLSAVASDAERALMTYDLVRQTRHLLSTIDGPFRAAEQAAAVTLAGAILAGPVGKRLVALGLRRLDLALPIAVAADGGHASRSARAGLELLLDLQVLEQALGERGMPVSMVVVEAMARLAEAARFFTLQDGALPDLQGSDCGRAANVAAAKIQARDGPMAPACNGFHRLDGKNLQVMVDAAPPAEGPWSVGACGQPLGIDVLARGQRLIVACGWSADAVGPDALRLVDAVSSLAVGEVACGAPLRGLRRAVLGPRLMGGCEAVEVRRHGDEAGLWLELAHDGWSRPYHLRHERRLFLNTRIDELRGEDRLTPMGDGAAAQAARRFIGFTIRFHLHPSVRASLARDGQSVLLQAGETGWRLRSDARETSVESSIHFQDGRARHSQQVVLRGQARQDAGAKVRWKLAMADAGA